MEKVATEGGDNQFDKLKMEIEENKAIKEYNSRSMRRIEDDNRGGEKTRYKGR